MNILAMKALLLDELLLTLLILAIFLSGAAATSFIYKPKAALRRVPYFFYVSLAIFGFIYLQLGWTYSAHATNVGLFWLLALFLFGALAVFGGVLYGLSAVRSNDIAGSRKYAWAGLVPIANLWLMLARGESARQADEAASSRNSDALVVLVSVGLLITGQGLEKRMEKFDIGDVDLTKLRELMAKAQSVASAFAQEAELSQADLPLQVDYVTRLVELQANGKTLTHIYEVSDSGQTWPADFKQTLAAENCAEDMWGRQMAKGGRMFHIYRGSEGQTLAEFELSQEDCVP